MPKHTHTYKCTYARARPSPNHTPNDSYAISGCVLLAHLRVYTCTEKKKSINNNRGVAHIFVLPMHYIGFHVKVNTATNPIEDGSAHESEPSAGVRADFRRARVCETRNDQSQICLSCCCCRRILAKGGFDRGRSERAHTCLHTEPSPPPPLDVDGFIACRGVGRCLCSLADVRQY